MRNRDCIPYTIAVLITLTSSVSAAPTREQQVRSFLKYHLSHGSGLTTRSIEARKSWLSPTLYHLLQREIQRQAAFQAKHPDEVPFFDGDVFTASQEVPTGQRVLSAPPRSTDVVVQFRFGPSLRVVWYRMRLIPMRTQKQWLIEDVISDGESLMRTLQRPDYMTPPRQTAKPPQKSG